MYTVDVISHARFGPDREERWYRNLQSLKFYQILRYSGVSHLAGLTVYNDQGEIWEGRVQHGYTLARQI